MSGGIKRDKWDKIFSDIVRTRDRWTCTRCRKYYPPGHRQGLHCSHFWGRANKGVRWDEENADAHCYGCHQFLSANPEEFRQWKFKRLGEEAYRRLELRARKPTKFTQSDKEWLYKLMQRRLKELTNGG